MCDETLSQVTLDLRRGMCYDEDEINDKEILL